MTSCVSNLCNFFFCFEGKVDYLFTQPRKKKMTQWLSAKPNLLRNTYLRCHGMPSPLFYRNFLLQKLGWASVLYTHTTPRKWQVVNLYWSVNFVNVNYDRKFFIFSSSHGQLLIKLFVSHLYFCNVQCQIKNDSNDLKND